MSASKADLQAWQSIVGATPDGNPGPATFQATVEWFRSHGWIKPPVITDDARARVVVEARAHLGAWTEGQVDELWREVGQPSFVGHWHDKAWCGGFALRCLRRVFNLDWTWRDGLGFLEVKHLPKVSLPEPGDIGYLAKNAHHFIVERCANGRVYGIDGNHFTAPTEGVGASDRAIADVSTFYSIRNLVAG